MNDKDIFEQISKLKSEMKVLEKQLDKIKIETYGHLVGKYFKNSPGDMYKITNINSIFQDGTVEISAIDVSVDKNDFWISKNHFFTISIDPKNLPTEITKEEFYNSIDESLMKFKQYIEV